MIDMTKSVVVLAGGHSAERAVSLRSGRAVLEALQAAGVPTQWFDPAESCLFELDPATVSCAFIALHGRGGEDGEVQAILNQLGIPYTGSKVMACALAMDKWRTKLVWQGLGLPTAAASKVTAYSHTQQDYAALLAHLGGRVMVKPAREGSSIGMSVADSAEALQVAVLQALEYDTEVLIEGWLSGPEYTVAIVGEAALPVIKVVAHAEFYDYEAKYQSHETEYICPAELTDAQEQQFRALAKEAFLAVGGEGWGRVDLMLNDQGLPQLLEVNMVPGMTEKSLVPMAAKQQGLSFTELVLSLVRLALNQKEQNKAIQKEKQGAELNPKGP